MLRKSEFPNPAMTGPLANPLRSNPASLPDLDGPTHESASAPDPQSPHLERPRPAPELSIVFPTFNERDNVPRLIDMLRVALPDIAWELIIVYVYNDAATTETAK